MNQLFEKKLISTKEAAELSGYTSDYLARLARSGKISARRIGHTWFVDTESLTHFLDQQGDRKIDYARALARAREAEYRKIHSSLHQAANTLTKPIQMPGEFFRAASSFTSHALSLSLALAVVICGALLARAEEVPVLAQRAATIASDVAFGFGETFGDIPERIVSKIDDAGVAMNIISKRVAADAARTSANIVSPSLAEIDFSQLQNIAFVDDHRTPRGMSVPPKTSSSVAPITTADLQSSLFEIYALISNPARGIESLVNAYRAIGTSSYQAISAAFSSYQSLIGSAGEESLALASVARDTLTSAPEFVSEVNLAFGSAVIAVTHAAIHADTRLAYSLADAAPKSARVVFDAEYAVSTRFIKDTNALTDAYLGTLTEMGRVAYEGATGVRSLALALRNLGEVGPSAIEDAYLATLGKSALALESFARTPKVAAVLDAPPMHALRSLGEAGLAAVLPAFSAGEQVALVTYNTIHDLFTFTTNSLANLFMPSPTIVYPVSAPTRPKVVTAPATRTSNSYTTVVNGVSPDFVNQSLNSLRNELLATIASAIRPIAMQTVTNASTIQQVNMIQDLHDLIVRNGDFRNSIFDNGIRVTAIDGSFTNLTGGITALASTTITGNLSVSGTITPGIVAATNYISAPYFVATSTTATSTFAGSLAIDTNGFVYATTTKNVGIGILSPAALLAIQNSTSTQPIFVASNAAGAEVYRITNAGFVGIGTTTPGYALAVEGSSSLGNQAIAGYFTATTTTATSTFAGALAIGTTSPWSNGLFTVGTSTPLLYVERSNGRIGIGTTTPDALLSLLQNTNGTPMISAYRATDTSPSGDFINYKMKDGTTLFRVDNSGNLLAGGIVSSGSQTITSTSQPQFRVQYDASNEITTSVGSTGTTTIAINGTSPSLAFTPSVDSVNTFKFTNVATAPILSVDTLNQRIGIGTTTPFANLSIAGSAGGTTNLFAISTSTSLFATTTALTIDQNGNLALNNGANLTVGGNATISGTLGVTGLTSFTDATSTNFSAGRLTANTFSAGQSASTTIDSAGNLATAGTLGVTGSTQLTSLTASGLSSLAFASSTLFSANQAYFGGTATSTFSTNGSLTLPTVALLTAPYASTTMLTATTASTTDLIASAAVTFQNLLGILSSNGTSGVSARTLTGTANQISIANGDGTAGNPTFSLPSLLFITNASSTAFSSLDYISVGRTATTTLVGDYGASSVRGALTIYGDTGSGAASSLTLQRGSINGDNSLIFNDQTGSPLLKLYTSANTGYSYLNGQQSYLSLGMSVGGEVLRIDTSNNARFTGNVIPSANETYDLGTAAVYWDNAYINNIVANNLSSASTSIAGTNTTSFSINSNNPTSDTQDMSLIFYRGAGAPTNAVLSWNATLKRFEFNQNTYMANAATSPASTTLRIAAVAGQTGALTSWLDSAGNVLSTVLADGSLGVGTSSPYAMLSVAGQTVAQYFTATSTTATNTFPIVSMTSATSTNLFAGRLTANTFAAGQTASTTIDSAGNLAVGGTLSVAGLCVTGDTRLRRRRKARKGEEDEADEDGYIYDEVAIKDVKEGDEIQSLDEKTGKLVWSRVKQLAYMGKKQTYKLTTASGKTIRTTANHPYLARQTKKESKNRVHAFIDASNLYYGAKENKYRIDFRKFANYLRTRYGVSKIFYYTGLNLNSLEQLDFYAQLERYGYEMRYVAYKVFNPGDDKADVDARMATDLLTSTEFYDQAIVITGDGDFFWTLQHLMKSGIEVKLFGYATRTARELKRLLGSKFADFSRLHGAINRAEKTNAADAIKGSAAGSTKLLYSAIYELSMMPRKSTVDKKMVRAKEKEVDELVEQILYGEKETQEADNPVKHGEGSWSKVSELKEGMEIAVADSTGSPQASGATWERIVSVEPIAEEDVYDIEVEGTHNFIGNDIVAHNTAIFNQASTTLFSANSAYFGATATSTFSSNGSLTLPTTALLTAPYASTTMITAVTASTTNLIASASVTFQNLIGMLSSNGTSGVTARTLTGTANQITIANGDGTGGNPTFSLPSTLVFTDATSTNHFSSRLTANTFSAGQTASTTIDSAGNLATAGTLQVTGQTTLATSLSGLLAGSAGIVYSTATSSLAIGSSLSNSGTLGSQIGGTASTLSLNMANVNSWTALQSFLNASSTLFSNTGTAYFGATATSTFDSAGALTLITPLLVSSGGTGWANIQAGAIPYGNGTGALATTTQGTGGQILAWNNGVPQFIATTTIPLAGDVGGTLSATVIGANKVTLGMLATLAANSVIGNITGSAATPTAVATSSLFSWNGTGDVVRTTSPTLVTPALGTPSALVLTNATGLPVGGGGTGAATLTGLLQGNGTSAITGITNSSTAGQVLRVTGASTYAWGALDLADTDAITGDLPFANLAQVSANSVLGNITGGTADATSIATSSLFTWNGTGDVVRTTSPTLITPTLGVASATSINKLTITTPATSATLTIIDGKTLTINKTISFTAADDTGVYTLPTGTKTLVATDVTTLSSLVSIGTITTGVWNGTDIAVADGGTGASTLTGLLQGNGTSAITGITGTAGQFPYYNGTNTLLATSTIFLATSGKIGIGTEVPGYKLDVNGDINISTGSNYKINGANLSPGSWVASGNDVYNSNSGNIGIGTSTPYSKLSVWGGGTGATAMFELTNSASTTLASVLNDGTFYMKGNVGIGTTGPGGLLHLYKGASGATVSSNSDLLVLEDDANNGINFLVPNTNNTNINFGDPQSNEVGFIQYQHATDALHFRSGGVTGMVIDTGNVGIGTAAPAGKLHVTNTSAGAATIAALLTNNDGTAGTETRLAFTTLNEDPASNRYGYIGYVINGVNGGDMRFATNVAGAGPVEAMRIINTGNVGIGTTSPVSKLSVVGESAFAGGGVFGLAYAGTAAPTNGLIIQGNVGIGTTSPAAALTVHSTQLNPVVIANPTVATDSTSDSRIEVRNNNNVVQLFAWQNLGARIGTRSSVNGAGDIYFTTDDTTQMYIKDNGNVGIGTTSPGAKMHIYSAATGAVTDLLIINSADYQNASAGARIRLGSSQHEDGSSYITSRSPSGNLSTLQLQTHAATSGSLNTGLFMDGTGNVGIGNTSPGTSLAIGSSATGGNNLGIYLNRGATANFFEASDGTKTLIAGVDSSQAFAKMGTLSNHDLAIVTNNNVAPAGIYLKTDGNVGIGTTTPDNQFTIARTSGGQTMRLDNTGTSGFITFSEAMAQRGLIGFGDNGNLLTGALTDSMTLRSENALHFAGGGNNLSMTIDTSGNVGIGTTSPLYPLHVVRYSGSNGTLRLEGNDNVVGMPSISFYNNNGGAQASISMNADGSGINTPGNVGIGTTSPDMKLTVRGTDNLLLRLEGDTQSGLALKEGDAAANNGFWDINATEERLQFRALNDINTAGTNFLRVERTGTTIDSVSFENGNVGIGTTSPATLLEVGGAAANVTFDFYKSCAGFTSNANGLLACTASDQRLKQDIATLATTTALSGINALRPVSFYWNPAADRGSGQQYGFVAQEVQGVFPNLVAVSSPTTLTPDGTLVLNYEGLIAPMILAIQELDAKARQLEPLAGVLSVVPGVESQCVTGDTKLRRRKKRKGQAQSDGNFGTGASDFDEFEFDEICIRDVVPGDEIQSLDERTGRVVYSRVNALLDMGTQEVFELVTKSGRRIRTTSNHPFLAREGATKS